MAPSGLLRPVEAKGFVVLPKRSSVERTFAWLVRSQRHSEDYERTTASSETMIYLSMIAFCHAAWHAQTRFEDAFLGGL